MFEIIRDFMKLFGFTLLRLDSMNPDTALQAVKQASRPNTQLFDSLSLQPINSIDELFQRGNQYAMLKDNVVAATKKMVASTSSESRDGDRGKGKGKRSRHNRDAKRKLNEGVSVRTSGHRFSKAPSPDMDIN